jgi:pyridoxal phosphate enzyme (YggS family)
MSIKSNINILKESIPSEVKVVAVSKFHSSEEIMEAYEAGQRIFGENRVQELVQKSEDLPKDIEWHFIGVLQRNKVKQIAPFISLIHSVDSMRLMQEIDKQAAANNRSISCLLQIHIAEEDTKSGFTPNECLQFLSDGVWKEYTHVKLTGIMGMATFTDNSDKVRSEFQKLRQLFDKVKTDYFANDSDFKEISMGMTGDYPVAINEGSTMIRVGTLIFGER